MMMEFPSESYFIQFVKQALTMESAGEKGIGDNTLHMLLMIQNELPEIQLRDELINLFDCLELKEGCYYFSNNAHSQ